MCKVSIVCDTTPLVSYKFAGESGISNKPFRFVCKDNYNKLNNNVDVHLVKSFSQPNNNSVKLGIHAHTYATTMFFPPQCHALFGIRGLVTFLLTFYIK